MGQALYRKYRSKSLAEIVGQEHITKTLDQALKQGRISHAYLFTGPRGVGKTSIARILAHEINDLPYEDDAPHIDIIEIDAASNRRIDEIRELREKVHTAPTSAKYKVYIIDEVHMLTREAFNALLKTLEEPPAHAVFILATTDAHKLPETIVSRTQRFSFRPAEKSRVVELLKDLAKKENIKISDPAIDLLAEHGEGSFRDSVSLLDQASSHGQKLELADVQQLLGIPPAESIEKLAGLVGGQGSPADVISQVEELYGSGYQPASIAGQLGRNLRRKLIENTIKMPGERALELLAHLIEVPAAHDPARYLEICLLKFVPAQGGQPAPDPEPEAIIELPPEELPTKELAPELESEPPPLVATVKLKAKAKAGTAALSADIWPDVLAALKKSHNTLYGVIRMAQPDFGTDGELKLLFGFAFHQKRGSEPANKDKLAKIIKELTGRGVKIECLLDKAAKPPKTSPAKVNQSPPADLSTISNIFGSAELLES
jgi:DNA polymerase III subunit gamma/tau